MPKSLPYPKDAKNCLISSHIIPHYIYSCKLAKLKLIVLTKLFFLEKIKDMLLSTLEHNLADT